MAKHTYEIDINTIIDKLELLKNKKEKLPISFLIKGLPGTGKTILVEEISKLCGTVKGKKGDKDNPLDGEPDRPLVTVTDLKQMGKLDSRVDAYER